MLPLKSTNAMKVVFITLLPGRMANRLISLHDFQALAHSYGYITVPCVFGWSSGIVGLRKHIFSRYILLRTLVPRVKKITLHPNMDEVKAEKLIISALESGKPIAIALDDWLPPSLRGRELPNPAKTRRYFSPAKRYIKDAQKVCNAARVPGQLLVGVHIRHGDFAEFDGGRWFISLEKVIENMQHMVKISGDVNFVVCSDAEFKAEDFPGLNVSFGPNHPLSDMMALSFCDLILKPAISTFAIWAAWWGNTPCLAMQAKPAFEISDFQVPTLDPFADLNGERG
jgi:hypothetical protein